LQQEIKKARAADSGANIAAVIDKAIAMDPIVEKEFGAQKLDELMKDQASKPAAMKYAAYLIDSVCHKDAQEDGTVQVCVKPGAKVEFIDYGEGVTPEDREMIFEPFWRKSEVTTGTGLGLAIVKDLVDALGGRITVADTPGGGATFKVTLKQLHDEQISQPAG
jgi:signal transduction histidine kinase